MTNKPEYTVVVPVYNSEGSLKVLHERLGKMFGSLGAPWELILVNDSSKDKSWEVMEQIAKDNPEVTAINLANNFGQHNAQMCGFSYARGNFVVTMDDDLQHPPEEIPKLIKTQKEGDFSVVYGQYLSKRHGWFRNFCSYSINKIIGRITGFGYTATHFRIIKRPVVEKIAEFKQYSANIDVFVKELVRPADIGTARVEHHARQIGKSNYSFGRLISYALNMIFNHTIWPLRFATIMGLFFSSIGIIVGLFSIIYFIFYGAPVRGWTSIFAAIALFLGIALFVLGIIGEYIGKIFFNINQKPQYFVKQLIKKNDD